MAVFLLVRRYIAYHKVKSLVVISCLSLTIYLPVTMQWFIGQLESSLTNRAQSTPMIIGAKGSRFDLAFCAMYYSVSPPEMIEMQDLVDVRDSGLATAIPLHVQFRAQGFPVVGTEPQYLKFRGLSVSSGDDWQRLGDCVVGAAVAKKLNLKPGDKLQTDPQNLFDLAGQFPLRMRVIGVLAPANPIDDQSVFVQLKTAWVIAGLGHGHEKPKQKHKTRGSGVIANAGVKTYTEITDENVKRFHFHGEPGERPISAILVVTPDERSKTILMGRFVEDDATLQVVQPNVVIDEVLAMVFRVRSVLQVAFGVLVVVTMAFVGLVMTLSMRLRQREMMTMFKLGASRRLVATLQTVEVGLLMAMSLLVAGVLFGLTIWAAPGLLQQWVVGS